MKSQQMHTETDNDPSHTSAETPHNRPLSSTRKITITSKTPHGWLYAQFYMKSTIRMQRMRVFFSARPVKTLSS